MEFGDQNLELMQIYMFCVLNSFNRKKLALVTIHIVLTKHIILVISGVPTFFNNNN